MGKFRVRFRPGGKTAKEIKFFKNIMTISKFVYLTHTLLIIKND